MPDGRHIQSTHSGMLPLLQAVPQDAQRAHQIPKLTHSLLSISKLCDNGCEALFTEKECKILHNGRIVLRGLRDKETTLWKIPISTSEGATQYLPISEGANFAFNLEQRSTKASIITFLHEALFSPVKSTWLRAIRRNHFITWPGINATDVTKHLHPTIASAKGHLDRR